MHATSPHAGRVMPSRGVLIVFGGTLFVGLAAAALGHCSHAGRSDGAMDQMPIILGSQSLLRIRQHDGCLQLREMLQNWAIFPILFELMLPRFRQVFPTTVDPLDVLAYRQRNARVDFSETEREDSIAPSACRLYSTGWPPLTNSAPF